MSKINITGNIAGKNILIGDSNSVVVKSLLDKYEAELLNLFNIHCPSVAEKEELLGDLKKIEINSPESSKYAGKILNFISSIGSGLVSNGLFVFLTELAKNNLAK